MRVTRLKAADEGLELRFRLFALVTNALDVAVELLQILERALLVEVERTKLFTMIHVR
jgi:hypothetical protein